MYTSIGPGHTPRTIFLYTHLRLPRLAWLTPLPPTKSGISQYNRDLLPALTSSHQIDLFVDARPRDCEAPAKNMRLFNAHDFLWKHAQNPYDLVVYQLGNATCHDYMWAYLVRVPGMVVLHDGVLHHARGRMLLQRWPPHQEEYRQEFWFNHPDANPDLAELGAVGLLGSLTYLWPMLRIVVESSRRVVVHNEWLAGQIREAHPSAAVDVVSMGVPAAAPRPGARHEVRSRHGIPEDAVVFTAFGKVTPEKRIREALRALTAVAQAAPRAQVLIAGETVDYYDMRAEAEALGIGGRVTHVGYLDDGQIDDYLEASDACLCMRWPTSRETSASWLRCLAAGKPTISTDLVHTADVPTIDPRDWSVLAGLKASAPNAGEGATNDEETLDDAKPVGVSIDILDEDHSLKLAMRRLATDEALRARLGDAARGLWSQRFRLELMGHRYREVIATMLVAPAASGGTRPTLPRHLSTTGTEHTVRLLREAGLPEMLLRELATRQAE